MIIDFKKASKSVVYWECKNRYYNFFKYAWKTLEPNRPLLDNWHIEYLCDLAEAEIRRIGEGKKKEKDIIINMPFRSLKSMIFSVLLHPWTWLNYPHLRFTSASYSESLALLHSNMSQRVITSDWYQYHFNSCFRMKSTTQGKSKIKETEQFYENDRGGYRFVSSVTGSMTGYGGDINIGDDLINAIDIHSAAKRKTANEFWKSVYPSRVQDFENSLFFLIMQRLSSDDPTAVSNLKDYKHIVIPAEDVGNIKPAGLKVYYKDGLFFPERFSKPVLEKLSGQIGINAYNAQILQKPGKGGSTWKENWFIVVDKVPKRFDKVNYYWDTAYTKDEVNSATAFVKLGYRDGYVYILDCGFRWVEFPEQIKWIRSLSGPNKIEKKATGKSSVQTLKNLGAYASEIELPGDKHVKANSVAPHIEFGKVKVYAPIKDLLFNDARQGILQYPEGSYDDLGDALAIGLYDMLGQGIPVDRSSLESILTEEIHEFN